MILKCMDYTRTSSALDKYTESDMSSSLGRTVRWTLHQAIVINERLRKERK